MHLERSAIVGESPVGEKLIMVLGKAPSNTGHVEPRANQRGPSRKAKYYQMTDSE